MNDFLLKRGDKGERVSDLQRQLAFLGYLTDSERHTDVSGYFDDTTLLAVRRFQRAHKLKDTGICDKTTWDAIGKVFDGIEFNFKEQR